MYNAIDDFVMTNLKTYAGRSIKTAEAEDIDLGDGASSKDGEDEKSGVEGGLSTEDADDLCSWLKDSALPDRVSYLRSRDNGARSVLKTNGRFN